MEIESSQCNIKEKRVLYLLSITFDELDVSNSNAHIITDAHMLTTLQTNARFSLVPMFQRSGTLLVLKLVELYCFIIFKYMHLACVRFFALEKGKK